MKIPLSWLNDFVEIKTPFKDLAARLSEAGLTVETWNEIDKDIIFDPEVTPNRPDWLSVYGVAREAAAVTNSRLKNLELGLKGKQKLVASLTDIKIKTDSSVCPQYTAVVVKNVKVKTSPDWMQARLKKVGLRPINNLVDITNYVMWELGNPLHVFDLDKIRGKEMHMDLSRGNETFTSLDGITYKLPPGAIIIKDVGRVIDLCGIKGGDNSAVDNSTTNILLHVPVYDAKIIRKTSTALGLRSDASAIYERGADISGTINALNRALDLITKLSGGSPSVQILDIAVNPPKERKIRLSHQSLEKVVGISFTTPQVLDIFKRLNLQAKFEDGNYVTVIPPFRQDLTIEEDLIEEVVRIYGFNRFPKTLPLGEVPTAKVAYHYDLDREYETKLALRGEGYDEIYTYALVPARQLVNLGFDPNKTLRIQNPISADFEFLRPTIFGNILDAYKLNHTRFEDLKLFELGKIYLGQTIDKVSEEYWIWAIISGEKFFQGKSDIETLLRVLHVSHIFKSLSPEENFPWLHPARAAVIKSDSGDTLGLLGEVDPSLLGKWGIKGRATVWGLNYDRIKKLVNLTKKYHPIPKFPPIIEDLTLVVPEGVLIGDILDVASISSRHVYSVTFLSALGENKTFRIEYLDESKNLTGEDAEKIRRLVLDKLKSELGVHPKS